MEAPIAILVLVGVLLLTSTTQAEGPNAESSHTTTQTTNRTDSALTEHERIRAELWALSDAEWQRYQALMKGIRGSISPPNLSPIEVLGIHARDEAERGRYARQWAEMMREDAALILAFQRAYDEAFRALNPDEMLIDVARLPSRGSDTPAVQRDDRLLLFTRPDCVSCDALLTRVLARLDRIAGVDLFVSGVAQGDDAAIRAWAKARGILPEWVKARRVTLNFDAGTRERIASGSTDLPLLMRRRGASVTPLSQAAL